MAELLAFPILSQLGSGVNALYNCVPASIAAGLEFLTKKKFDPEVLKDWAYGADYANSGTAARAFIGYCANQGVDLYPVENSDHAAAIACAHQQIQKGIPVIFTQQDDYSTNPAYTHVCIWFRESPGYLACMDPFGGKVLTYSDQTWNARLRTSELWCMEKTMPLPHNWTDNGTTLYPPDKSFPVIKGFRERILNSDTWDAGNVPREAEKGVDQVELHANTGAGTRQIFRDCVLLWTKDRGVKNTAAGDEIKACYDLIASLQKQIADLKAPKK